MNCTTWFKNIYIIGLVGTGSLFFSPAPALSRNNPLLPIRSTGVIGIPKSNLELRRLVAQAKKDVIDTAVADGTFKTFVELFEQLGMAEDLRGFGRFTVFAPTDAAFNTVPPNVMKVLLADRKLMAEVLAYHVSANRKPLMSSNLKNLMEIATLKRSQLKVTKDGENIRVNGAEVIKPNIVATNGVIHGIDTVLIPNNVMMEIQKQMQQ